MNFIYEHYLSYKQQWKRCDLLYVTKTTLISSCVKMTCYFHRVTRDYVIYVEAGFSYTHQSNLILFNTWQF